MDKDYINYNPINDGSFGLNLKDFFKIFKRRKKYFILGFSASILSAISLTIYQRIFTPEYTGFFTILINDPINKNKSNTSQLQSPVFDQFSLGSSGNDIPTLIEYLSSSAILKDTVKIF